MLAREVVAPGSPLSPRIAEHFGARMLQKDGSLDRAALRERVFANPAERQWLEQPHPSRDPRAHRRALRIGHRAATSSWRFRCWWRPGGAKRFDRVLVVDCEPELQLARLQARDGSTARQAAQRMLAAQATREQRLAVADDVIQNNGDIAALRDQVEKLHRQYSAAAS